jgi:hypothetical protein
MIQNSLHSLIFKKVISKPSFQLPYYLLDMEDRDYLRMRSQLYGYSFNKNYRKYNLWFTMGLKKNINILAPFFFEFSSYHTFDTINSKT